MSVRFRSSPLAFAGLLLAACGGGLHPDVDISDDPPERLSELGLVSWDGAAFTYAEGVFPYELNTPLFSDYAVKDRAIYLPEGTSAVPGGPADVLDFPVGTAILKTFSLAPDLRTPGEGLSPIETRLLWRTEDGWEAWPYLWRDDGSDADLHLGGRTLTLDFVDPDGEAREAQYMVPQRNQCGECHQILVDDETVFTPIGPRPSHLAANGQLEAMVQAGLVSGLNVDDVVPTTVFGELDLASLQGEALNTAARDYLDVNCAHCHRPDGVQGVTSQLFLNRDNDDPFRLGICKRPGSAGQGGGGLTYDIVPGAPEESILYFRLSTENPGAMMPLLGRSLAHTEGVDLIGAWIAAMEPDDCAE